MFGSNSHPAIAFSSGEILSDILAGSGKPRGQLRKVKVRSSRNAHANEADEELVAGCDCVEYRSAAELQVINRIHRRSLRFSWRHRPIRKHIRAIEYRDPCCSTFCRKFTTGGERHVSHAPDDFFPATAGCPSNDLVSRDDDSTNRRSSETTKCGEYRSIGADTFHNRLSTSIRYR